MGSLSVHTDRICPSDGSLGLGIDEVFHFERERHPSFDECPKRNMLIRSYATGRV